MNLLSELKRRNVFRVAIAYLVFGWLVLQVADVLFPALHLPDWSITLVAVLLAIGFVPAMIFAWAYELTPEGLKRESEVDRSQSVTHETARRLDLITIAMVVIAASVLVADRLWFDQASEPQRAGTPHDYSIAVLPFDDLSDTQDQEYFSDGLTEELLNRLAKVDGFRVAGRTSAFAFRDRPDDLRVIGEKLNVATILEGSVRKAGDQLRITAQLINVADGYHLWSETFDRRVANIFEIQDQIAGAVVRELSSTLMGESAAEALDKTVTTDPAAYELYLRGRHQLWQRRADTLREARQLFEQAIEIDPDYAPAYAGLSDSLVFQVAQGYAGEVASLTAAEKAIDQAMRIDAGNAEVLASLGLLRRWQGQQQAARDALRPAIALNPSNPQAHIWLSNTYADADPQEALRLARRAYEIDPLARIVVAALGNRLQDFGRLDETLTLAAAMHSQYPDSGWGYQFAGDVHYAAGNLDDALKSYYAAYRVAPDRGAGFARAPFALLDLGALELAETWSTELQRAAPGLPQVLWARARLAFERGRPAQAVQVFEEAAAGSRNPWFRQQVGIARLLSGDFDGARESFELGLHPVGRETIEFDPERWRDFIDFTCALQRTGSVQLAADLIARSSQELQRILDTGAVSAGTDGFDLFVRAAMMSALSGDTEKAISDLRRAASRGSLNCIWCLFTFPQFDRLREEPDFKSLIEEQETRLDEQRQRLAREGMLLTPEQVLSVQEFDYDPFSAR